MLYLIKAAIEVAHFTSDVVLWSVINSSKLILSILGTVSALVYTVVSEVLPAALTLLQQAFYFSLEAVNVLYEVILLCMQFIFSLLHSIMLYTALLITSVVQGVTLLFKAVLSMNWSLMGEYIGSGCVKVSEGLISVSFFLYNSVANISSSVGSAILYFTMVVYSVASIIFTWSLYLLENAFSLLLYILENAILLSLFCLQSLFSGITVLCSAFGRTFQFLGSKVSFTSTTMTDILNGFSDASISATSAAGQLIIIGVQYLLMIGLSLLLFFFLFGCTYHLLSVAYVIWNRGADEKREQDRRRRDAVVVPVARREHVIQQRRNGRQHRMNPIDDGVRRRKRAENQATARPSDFEDIDLHEYLSTMQLSSRHQQQQLSPSQHQEHSLHDTSATPYGSDFEAKLHELETKYMKEVESKQCVVCLDLPRKFMIRPCNHYCVCETCSRRLKKCPVCTMAISRFEKVFES